MRERRPAPTARHRARAPEERSLTDPVPHFIGSFPRADAPLDPPLPEIALVGRSNVGKSSLLNALAGRRIARISTTPGKTRLLNVYLLTLVRGAQYAVSSEETRPPDARREQPRAAHRALYLLDLPGYGYARAGKSDRAAFRRLIAHTLSRTRLTGVLWLLDVRRDPAEGDREMQALFAARGTRVLAAITKSDKLPRGQRVRREQAIRAALGLAGDQIVVTSARLGEGIGELREAIELLVQEAAE